MHCMGTTDRVSTSLRETDVPDVTRLDHVCDRTNGVLNRHGRINTCGAVDIDVVCAKSASNHTISPSNQVQLNVFFVSSLGSYLFQNLHLSSTIRALRESFFQVICVYLHRLRFYRLQN